MSEDVFEELAEEAPPVHENVDGSDLPEEQDVEQPEQRPSPIDSGGRVQQTPATRLLTIAAKELGTLESPRGSNKIKYWSVKPGWNGQPWCAAFVRWCLLQADLTNYPPIANPYYVPYVESWGRNNNKFIRSGPNPGDLVIFGKSDIAAHIGFVERRLDDGWVQTIEGNTSSGTSGSQNNGDGVFRRKRGPSWIRGYVRVEFPAVPDPRGGGTVTTTISEPATIKTGTTSLLTVDGKMGPQTRRAFQQLVGLSGKAVTGTLDKASWRAAQKWAGLSGADLDGVCGPGTSDAIARKTGHTELLGTVFRWKDSSVATGHAREIQAAFNRALHEGLKPS